MLQGRRLHSRPIKRSEQSILTRRRLEGQLEGLFPKGHDGLHRHQRNSSGEVRSRDDQEGHSANHVEYLTERMHPKAASDVSFFKEECAALS